MEKNKYNKDNVFTTIIGIIVIFIMIYVILLSEWESDKKGMYLYEVYQGGKIINLECRPDRGSTDRSSSLYYKRTLKKCD